MSGIKLRLLIAGGIVLLTLFTYYASSQKNPITGESQRVGGITAEQEVQMGLNSMPPLVQQFDGQSRDLAAQRNVDIVGARLLNALEQRLAARGVRSPYPFEFHLLADRDTVNAFALPGGQVFITEALYYQLETEGQLAGVIGHEIGHVLERHSAQRMAKARLTEGLAGAAGVAGGSQSSAQMAAFIGDMVTRGHSRDHELESDRWGIELMLYAGYDPSSLNRVMDILEKASGGNGPPEFMSTHPKPANRREYINRIIQEKFPGGVPAGLIK
jgi:predicted Zn-dependent protease